MSDLARAMIAVLDDEALNHLAQRLTPHLGRPDATQGWVDVDGAARHLACNRRRVYDLVSRRESNGFPVHRDGRRLLFRPSELDEWLQRDSPANGLGLALSRYAHRPPTRRNSHG
jgi:excisionase family DNA binding protein